MHCSEFREHHCAFVDDTLAGVELVRMQRHVAECPSCAELDARVRRSLMLARSLPHIEPSPEFGLKLEARLRACRVPGDEDGVYANFRIVAVVGAVASLLMLGYMAESLRVTRGGGGARDLILPPVVAMAEPPEATQPEVAQPEVAQPEIVGVATPMTAAGGEAPAPAIIASMAAGMPLWPAALFAEQAPLHFASYRKTVH